MSKLSPESEKRIKEAMKHPFKLGAGAKLRKKLTPKETFAAVMKEWKAGKLGTRGKGGKNVRVKSQAQALAIAFSEMEERKKGK